MLFRYVSKLVLILASATAGLLYIVAKTAWAGLDETAYMNPFLLMTAYVFYVWLITPFNVRYVFAAPRNPDLTEYKLIFFMKLTEFAALYTGILTVETGIIGLFTKDVFVFIRVVNYLVYLLLNLNVFNIWYIVLCDKIKNIAARMITFSLPVIGALVNNFGGEAAYKLNFLYFGMHGVSVLNAAIVYIVVFSSGLFLLLKKGKREYA